MGRSRPPTAGLSSCRGKCRVRARVDGSMNGNSHIVFFWQITPLILFSIHDVSRSSTILDACLRSLPRLFSAVADPQTFREPSGRAGRCQVEPKPRTANIHMCMSHQTLAMVTHCFLPLKILFWGWRMLQYVAYHGTSNCLSFYASLESLNITGNDFLFTHWSLSSNVSRSCH